MSADNGKIVFWWVMTVLFGSLTVWSVLTSPSNPHWPLQSSSQNRHHPDNGYKEGNIYVG